MLKQNKASVLLTSVLLLSTSLLLIGAIQIIYQQRLHTYQLLKDHYQAEVLYHIGRTEKKTRLTTSLGTVVAAPADQYEITLKNGYQITLPNTSAE
ncbi:hypothetical protein IV38_GL001930 [Lactobacillus selangorensis]|uniref:Uncharacterized protein n=1 Tax=Lactobacillus selangorensis TaxID=81857 RepID=A0A0R2FMW8_9LACO|nr:hypothetical protein [Lactobacillus selangorensis]KRN27717.1 hypothetical protein IV38_GL001930 [Lactobacillus selangorensis]KRN30318.1 hypothetical protein IV40_GL001907 [Lactobacillus selangorensis]